MNFHSGQLGDKLAAVKMYLKWQKLLQTFKMLKTDLIVFILNTTAIIYSFYKLKHSL